jgi:putative sporulation protein YtaF
MVRLAITIIVLAISLSIDSLGVGLVYGFRKISIPLFPKLLICLFSIIYSAVALTLGKTLSNILSPGVSKLIGVVILTLMGIWIIFQALTKNHDEGVHNSNIRIKRNSA